MSNTTIDFTHADGFPLTQRTLQIMQDSYREALKGLAALGGDMVILSGLEEDSGGSVLTDGWVFVDGELLPFEGGTKTARFVIEEATESRTFEPGVDKDVYTTRTAKFGSNPGHDYDFDALTRLDSIKTHQQNKDNPHEVTKEQVGLGNLPNAKSDSFLLKDSDSLATNKAVSEVFARVPRITHGNEYVGNVGGGSGAKTRITHNLGNVNYIAFITIISHGSSNNDNDLTYAIKNKTEDYFDVYLDDTTSHINEISLDWMIIYTDNLIWGLLGAL